MKNLTNIIISRTDSIGDMVLVLPMAKALKDKFPNIQIAILGHSYTRPIVEACVYADAFIALEDFMNGTVDINGKPPQAIVHAKTDSKIAKRAKALRIPIRAGTTGRLYHWFTCNRLIPLSRKRSHLHEAQLNLKLLSAFGIRKAFSLPEIATMYGLTNVEPLENRFASLLDKNKYNLILHPKSRGNAREWAIENFVSLIQLLDPLHYKIFITGTAREKELIQPLLDAVGERIIDLTAKIPLAQTLSFINECDGLVACSTGPVHIAAALGKDTYGLYVPLRSISAGRWGPIGENAQVFEAGRKNCEDCKLNKELCHCINEILPAYLLQAIQAKASAKSYS